MVQPATSSQGRLRMKRMILLFVVSAILVLALAVPAFAAPSGSGTCRVGGQSEEGASGCAGSVGGAIETPHQGCKQINQSRFNEFACF